MSLPHNPNPKKLIGPIIIYDDPWPYPTIAERERCETEAALRDDGMIEVPAWFADMAEKYDLDTLGTDVV